jgi:hypothetical protein
MKFKLSWYPDRTPEDRKKEIKLKMSYSIIFKYKMFTVIL